ncbi:IS256 family transposase [wastewater metagenome]|uniref:IS256 family transposase ISSpma2 n=3 Tax=root TaxID=1 RepID=A0A5B8RKB2_9ZZZZ|nr:IS256 family transposase ISSpma2 [uncultured organism]
MAGVQLVISDAHAGLKKAVAQVLGASWQRCRVHFMRDVLAHVHKRHQSMVAAAIRTAFAQQNGAEARAQWRETAESLRSRFPKVAAMMDAAEDEVLAHTAFPAAHWSKIASTNPLERVNKEIKRRSDVVGIFPNEAAITRLVGAVVLEQSEEWQVGRCYIAKHSLAELHDEDNDEPKQIDNAA